MTKAKQPEQQELIVQRRVMIGKRPMKRVRREGVVPGVIYGKGTEPISIHVNQRELVKFLRSKAGEHTLVRLRIEEGKGWEKPVLVKAVQQDPVDGHVLHVDFHAIALTERIRIKVPIVLKGEPVGVRQEGGILEHFLREVEIECLPTEIPAGVEFDVSAMTIGQTIHVSDLIPPPPTKITSDPAGAIASVQKPKEEKPVEEAAALTEPEVIREKKEEEEAPETGKGEAGEAKKETKAEK